MPVTAMVGAITPVAQNVPVGASTTTSTSTTVNRGLTIGSVNITGTWDIADPQVPRQFVARLYDELDRYEKEHR